MIRVNYEMLPGARAPAKGSIEAAGYDLSAYFAAEKISMDDVKGDMLVRLDEAGKRCVIIPPGHRRLISSGVKMAIEPGFYGRIAPRSGLAYKNGIDTLAGVIDSDYRAVVGVILQNLDPVKPFVITEGDRIAQIIYEMHKNATMMQVDDISADGGMTARGDGGFGSTGVH